MSDSIEKIERLQIRGSRDRSPVMTKPIKFFIDIPPWESLTPEQQEAPGYPITVGYESIEDYFRHVTSASPSAIADSVVERVAAALDDKQKAGPNAPPAPPSDDAIVDQRTAPVPRDLYLRLARAKAFPSTKIGKRVTATWGDVKKAFASYGKNPKPTVAKTKPAEPTDGLDDLRSEIGLTKKGE